MAVDRPARLGARALGAHLGQPGVDTWVGHLEDDPVGYAELVREGGDVEIASFGLLPGFAGRASAARCSRRHPAAWDRGAERVWLHTCSLDSPAALPSYERRGFRRYEERDRPVLGGRRLQRHRLAPRRLVARPRRSGAAAGRAARPLRRGDRRAGGRRARRRRAAGRRARRGRRRLEPRPRRRRRRDRRAAGGRAARRARASSPRTPSCPGVCGRWAPRSRAPAASGDGWTTRLGNRTGSPRSAGQPRAASSRSGCAHQHVPSSTPQPKRRSQRAQVSSRVIARSARRGGR